MLSGDRNVSTNSDPLAGFLTIQTQGQVRWTKDIHRRKGNIGLVDGSVSEVTTDGLRKIVQKTLETMTNAPIRLVLP